MYTVIRFVTSDAANISVEQIAATLNQIQEGICDGKSRRGRISCSICTSPLWDEHEKAISDFIDRFGNALTMAQQGGTDTIFDVAVEPEDYGRDLFYDFTFSKALLKKLAQYGVEVATTIYFVAPDVHAVSKIE